MRFLRFGQNEYDGAITLYPVNQIDTIVLYDSIYEDEQDCGEFKILLFLIGHEKAMSEIFPFDTKDELKDALKAIRSRFDEIEGLLNA